MFVDMWGNGATSVVWGMGFNGVVCKETFYHEGSCIGYVNSVMEPLE